MCSSGLKILKYLCVNNMFKLSYFPTWTIVAAITCQCCLATSLFHFLDQADLLLLREAPGHPHHPVQKAGLQIEEESLGDALNGEMKEIFHNL